MELFIFTFFFFSRTKKISLLWDFRGKCGEYSNKSYSSMTPVLYPGNKKNKGFYELALRIPTHEAFTPYLYTPRR